VGNVSAMIIHLSGQPIADTLLYQYDNLNRLTQYHEGESDTVSNTYQYTTYNFLYNGDSLQPYEYSYMNNSSVNAIHLLTFNASGNLIEDSSTGNGNLMVHYGTNMMYTNFFSNGVQYGNVDSLYFDQSGNITQWTEDTLSGSNYLQSFSIQYSNLTSYLNPLYNLKPIAPILFKYGITGLDPAFYFSKYLPGTESESIFQINYLYGLNGPAVTEIVGEVPLNGNFTVYLYY
jgi:hypothetical protein